MSQDRQAGAGRTGKGFRSFPPWLRFLLWLSLYQGLTLAGPHLPLVRNWATDVLSLVFFSALAVALLLAAAEVCFQHPLPLPLWLAGAAMWTWLRFGLPTPWVEMLRPLSDALLIAVAVGAGRGVAGLIGEAGLFAVVLVVAGVVDVLGVAMGPVALALQKAPELVRQMSVQVPKVGSEAAGAVGMVSLIGVGDFLFLGLLFGGVRRLGLDVRATACWTFALMSLGLTGVMVLGAALPGLVFICAAGLIANRRFFRFTDEEKQALLIAAGLFLLLLLAGWWWLSRGRPEAPQRIGTGPPTVGSETNR